MSTTDTKTTIQARIAKLLAQADDRAGTPEGDVFQAKAFELMAQYDIEEAQARHGVRVQADAEGRCVVIRGKYAETQMMLLNAIAMESYCQVIKTANDTCWVYGMATHLDNVETLFARLVPSMLAQAGKARPSYPVRDSGELRVFRRSFMRGFAAEVRDRLQVARREAEARNRDADGSAGAGALVLVDDAQRAQVALRKAHPRVRQTRSAARSDHGGTFQGRQAGAKANLGRSAGLAGSRRALN